MKKSVDIRAKASSANSALFRVLVSSIGCLLMTSFLINVLYHSRLPSPQSDLSQLISRESSYVQHLNKTLWSGTNKAQQVEKRNKKGQILHHSITAIKQEDLRGVGDDATIPKRESDQANRDMGQARQGREELLAILKDAGVEDIDVASVLKLPLWSEVQALYGDGPVVYGLDTCEDFRANIPREDASIGTAGLFNTGTNPFNMYLEGNCIMPENEHDHHGGMRWQVPWGKHMLASRKWNNTAGHDHKVNKSNVLPVVLIRDPYSWMQSMCKHPYATSWSKNVSRHCPNLVPTPEDRAEFSELGTNESIPVRINYPNKPADYPSLAHFWSDWYQQYLQAEYPRLLIRFEDLIFHQKSLLSIVCACAGAIPKQDTFSYVVDAGKWGSAHKGSSNMISAMVKYGSNKKRLSGLTNEDLSYAQEHLSAHLMTLFQYAQPPEGGAALS
ncbi:predicted protein [Phaeodactylum tricornutum CCAP 1055/1]|jgi:hypothetical protein|uniref:Uncharacterized protein n=2 Tax=Phaeodactylum tricornutum TaxID=2850 RepID=B7G8I2_PHATC|nr:predicted protein [Phaeodactylum tricornutum CCAP 1055/1]EEC45174.1 predicted protein [Phaeodactylum tricornutum CCAP 1055/1]|eukprot:XP_002183474.1 predicted protein [Phaeodactylum tricornutum CCAP 1055/1]